MRTTVGEVAGGGDVVETSVEVVGAGLGVVPTGRAEDVVGATGGGAGCVLGAPVLGAGVSDAQPAVATERTAIARTKRAGRRRVVMSPPFRPGA